MTTPLIMTLGNVKHMRNKVKEWTKRSSIKLFENNMIFKREMVKFLNFMDYLFCSIV